MIGGGAGHAQSGAGLESDRNRRFQSRRQFRHPVAEHEHRPGLDLGDEREQLDRRRTGEPQSRAGLASDRNRRFQPGHFSDILFQNKNTGQVSVWEMNGTSLIGGGPVSANPGTSWHAIGTGAGGSDILLQNTSGQASIWEMNGNTIAGGGPVSPIPGRAGSGRPDLSRASPSASASIRREGERCLGDAGFERVTSEKAQLQRSRAASARDSQEIAQSSGSAHRECATPDRCDPGAAARPKSAQNFFLPASSASVSKKTNCTWVTLRPVPPVGSSAARLFAVHRSGRTAYASVCDSYTEDEDTRCCQILFFSRAETQRARLVFGRPTARKAELLYCLTLRRPRR